MTTHKAAGVSRRAILRGTAAAAAMVAAVPAQRAWAAPGSGKRVAVLGGGPAGLTAAHELAERGFSVTVFERRALGGKARSMPVPGSGKGGRADLPGEHGFRFFPGFYNHIPDTMRRIPFPGNANGVFDNLVGAPHDRFSRQGGDDFVFSPSILRPDAKSPEAFRQTLGAAFATALKVAPAEGMYFANRLLVFNSSCDARRFGQWEQTPWRDFVGARERSAEFRTLFTRTLTSLLVAAKPETASTRTIANMGEQFLGEPLQRNLSGPLDRLLNGPTNEAWIDPWVAHLRSLGVVFNVGATVTGLATRDGRIATAQITDASGVHTVAADYFVVALPHGPAAKLWSQDILALDPSLQGMNQLHTEWMTGIQFYLKRQPSIVDGHAAYIDSPWALTSINQNQFWSRKKIGPDYGDGVAQDCMSVDISDWDRPGMLFGKPAKECTHDEIAREVWAQLLAHLGDRGPDLCAGDLHSWFLDPGITWDAAAKRNLNADPFLVNTAGSWAHRPQARTRIENLVLAGDYLRTNIDLATMEGANESAREAVNAVLDASGSSAGRCRKYQLYRAPELEPFRQLDIARYAAGQPNLFDANF